VPVGTIKRSLTGSGNASKGAVERRGFAPKDDNEADTIALLLCVSPCAKAANTREAA
jgi:hypothetical protein